VDDEDLDSASKERIKSDKSRRKNKKKGRSSKDSSDDDLVKIKKGSRKKKWYSSDEDSSPYSSESESDKDEKRKSKSKNKRDDFPNEMEIARKEMGLDWMLRAQSKKPAVAETEENVSEVPVEEVCLG